MYKDTISTIEKQIEALEQKWFELYAYANSVAEGNKKRERIFKAADLCREAQNALYEAKKVLLSLGAAEAAIDSPLVDTLGIYDD